jgi:hypothetical protein
MEEKSRFITTSSFEEFFQVEFPNVQIPEIQNLNLIPGNNNAHDSWSLDIPR